MRIRNLSISYSSIAILAVLLAMASLAPLLRQQLVTGIIVNATLFIGVSVLGLSGALILGVLPSAIALATGLLPPVLAPMVPFIIAGNLLLVVSFYYTRKFNYWAGGIAAAILKFAFIFGTSFLVTGILLDGKIGSVAAQMMGITQLFTALGGAVLAYGVIRLAGKHS